MVKDKGTTGFRVESNFREIIEPKPDFTNITGFGTKVPRKDKDYINSLSDSRFEIINKSPEVITNVPRVPGFNFKKQLKRPHELFGHTETGAFYDVKIDMTKPRLDSGIPKLISM